MGRNLRIEYLEFDAIDSTLSYNLDSATKCAWNEDQNCKLTLTSTGDTLDKFNPLNGCPCVFERNP